MFTCGEVSKKVVTSDSVHDTGDKYGQRNILSNVRFTINEPISMREFHQVGKRKTCG